MSILWYSNAGKKRQREKRCVKIYGTSWINDKSNLITLTTEQDIKLKTKVDERILDAVDRARTSAIIFSYGFVVKLHQPLLCPDYSLRRFQDSLFCHGNIIHLYTFVYKLSRIVNRLAARSRITFSRGSP